MKILKDTYVIILAGGIGSRFWPISRKSKPKQFIDILGTGKTLLQEAYERYTKIVEKENIYVIANESYSSLVSEQLPQLDERQILGEPMGKNTAACVAYAAYKISEKDKNGVLIIAPSDHLIQDNTTFIHQVHTAQKYAQKNDALVTLGLKPHRPDTGYGYIQYDEQEVSKGVNKVVTFTEKPPLELAEKFLESGDFLWNSGMFVWSASSILKALNDHLPELSLTFAEGRGAYNTDIEKKHIERIYSEIPSISIDNGLLEKADNVYVLPSDFGWSDLGTWKSVQEELTTENDNTVLNVDLEAINSVNNLVVSDKKKLVVVKDLDGYFIVDTDDALLICKVNQEQEVKKIASEMAKKYKGMYS
ncbi:MAG: sugar phosphate nucleotidyltransferase [Bacteroidia bacterium]|jgi:mannose-1-phosphate guanylyltransferase|nr:sugar phosphate nucleotidyltransferase [Bacteroidia bacterium]